MVYFVIGMALHSDGSYEDVMAHLTDGLSWASGWRDGYVMPSKSGIFQARDRLGAEPVEALFRRVARPLAGPDTPGSWLAGRRLVALDGSSVDVADTAANGDFFGRPGSPRGTRAGFPQARVVALIECGTHAVLDAEIGPFTRSELASSEPIVDRLEPGMLVLADRGFYGFPLWSRAAATGADLLWRVKKNTTGVRPELIEELSDGSWLAWLHPRHQQRHRRLADASVKVRVIDYSIDDGRAASEEYRLLTTITDPDQASAEALAMAYAQRWEIETVFDELKTHQRGPKAVLRSKSPPLVQQELWGHLCCHYAIRTLMADTAARAGEDPDRVSFTAALRVSRRSIAHQGDFSPSQP